MLIIVQDIMGGAMYSSGGSNEPPELAIFFFIYI